MLQQKRILTISFVAASIMCLAVSSILVSHSQTKNEVLGTDAQNQDRENGEARLEAAKSSIGSMTLQNITAKNSHWKLQRAQHFERRVDNNSERIGMLFSNGENRVGFDVIELNSVKEAEAKFHGQRSYGGSVKFNQYGDKGDMLLHDNGKFMALRFRQGNYFVQIFSPDQKAAELFAATILESLPK